MSAQASPYHKRLTLAPGSWHATLSSGLTLSGLCVGDPDAPLIIAIHGWLDNAASFTALAALLATSYRVIAIDLPGHGRSEHPSREGIYHFINWCVWLDELIEVLEIKEAFTLLGHSMGAGIVTCYAGACERDITRVIAIDGIAPATTPASQTAEQLRRGIKSRRRALTREASRVKDAHDAVEKMKTVRMPMSDQALHCIAARHLRHHDTDASFAYDVMLQSTSTLRLTPTQLRALLSSIKAPVHLIRASQGWPFDPQQLDEIISWIGSHTQISHVEGGHHVHMDSPELVHEAILRAHDTSI